ncbi:MAG: DUF4142 domain-containing protein [Nostoc sp. TH1S01]|nr:DUF4142 domain-containing protein [Nostoc sp. TH1S01]
MNLPQRRFTRKFINFINIFGISTVIVNFSSTAFSASHSITALFSQNISSTSEIRKITQTSTDRNPGLSRPKQSLSELDRLYVTEAAQGGMTEIQMAKLALQRSRNNEVKQFAQQMIQEHIPVNQQLMQLANQKRITIPTTLGPKYQAAIARLSQFSGGNFDQAYKEEAGINLHTEYLVVQRRESQFGQDSDLQGFASKNIPIALKHLQMGQRLLTQTTPR